MNTYIYKNQAISLFIYLEYYDNEEDLKKIKDYYLKIEKNHEKDDYKLV